MHKPTVFYRHLGRMDYREAWDLQTDLHKSLVEYKRAHREDPKYATGQKHYLLFCEHPPVYTLGKSGDISNLLLSEEERDKEAVSFYKINRGGDITYHGPGQIVVYPIFDMDCFFTDVHKYVRYLEEVVIRTLADFDIEAIRIKEYTGVWLPGTDDQKKRKICAIGVHLSRWVTMHGLAFNINTDLNYFDHIIPCGIQEDDKTVTSMSKELDRPVPLNKVIDRMKYHFADLFDFNYAITPSAPSLA